MPAIRGLLASNITDDYLPEGRVAQSELYWVSAEMTRLAVGAAAGLPEWTPGLAVPAEAGLLLWDGTGTPELPVYTLPTRYERTNIYGKVITTWAPLAGLLWAVTGVEVLGVALVRTQDLHDAAASALAGRFPVVVPACTLPLMLREQAARPDSYQEDVRALMRLVGTTWLLMGSEHPFGVPPLGHWARSARWGTPIERPVGVDRRAAACASADRGRYSY